MSSISLFNTSLHDFVDDLNKMNIMKKEVNKLSTYIEITRVNSQLLIRNFQKYILRDIFVKNIILNNSEFFLKYDLVKEFSIDEESIIVLITKVQDVVKELILEKQTNNILCTFNWLKILCYHAYCDLGIDAGEKMKNLSQSEKEDIIY